MCKEKEEIEEKYVLPIILLYKIVTFDQFKKRRWFLSERQISTMGIDVIFAKVKSWHVGEKFQLRFGSNFNDLPEEIQIFQRNIFGHFFAVHVFILLLLLWETEKRSERWGGQDTLKIKRVRWKCYVNKLSFIIIIKTNKLERWNKNNFSISRNLSWKMG